MNDRKDIRTAPFMTEFCDMTANMYRLGWDERNGGNISLLLDEAEAGAYLDLSRVLRTIPIQFDAAPLAGKIFLVTGTGKYFKNVSKKPEENLGIVRIAPDGASLELLWGFEGGAAPTSEFPTHLMNHMARLKTDPEHRVVMHCHPVNTIALTFVCPADEREITRTLWGMCSECIVVFPDGVGLVPWMVSGTNAIGEATAQKIQDRRLVLWAQHGIFAAGHDLDEAFGLIETVEKAAEIYMKIAHLEIKNRIPEEQLKDLAKQFHVTPREGYLGTGDF